MSVIQMAEWLLRDGILIESRLQRARRYFQPLSNKVMVHILLNYEPLSTAEHSGSFVSYLDTSTSIIATSILKKYGQQ